MIRKILMAAVPIVLLASQTFAVVPGHFMDAVYKWPKPVYNADVNFTLINDPGSSSYYWSHFFSFQNTSGTEGNARQGYTGLQTHLKGSKTAIFSIWNALAAQGTDCQKFGGEGIGYRCQINYNFVPNRTYRVRVWQLASDETGDWWGAWVKDNTSGIEQFIGSIKSPPKSGYITTSYLFDEYYSSVASCSALPYAKMKLTNLVGNNSGIKPKFSYWVPEGPCASSTNVVFNGTNDFTVSTPY